MKLLVILGLLVVYVQAEDEPLSFQQLVQEAFLKCVKENQLDPTKIKAILSKPTLPEDDSEFTAFFGCYWKVLGILDGDGSVNHENIKVLLPKLLQDKFKLPTDKAEQLAEEGRKECESVSTGPPTPLTGIKSRNCVISYALKALGQAEAQ